MKKMKKSVIRYILALMMAFGVVTQMPMVSQAGISMGNLYFGGEDVEVDFDGTYHEPKFTATGIGDTLKITYTYTDENTNQKVTSEIVPKFRKPGEHFVKASLEGTSGNSTINLSQNSTVTILLNLVMGNITVNATEDGNFTVGWVPVDNADKYKVYYSETSDFSDAFAFEVNKAATSATPLENNVNSNTLYYVKVIPLKLDSSTSSYYEGTASEVVTVKTGLSQEDIKSLPKLSNFDYSSNVMDWQISDAADFYALDYTVGSEITVYLTRDLTVDKSVEALIGVSLDGMGHTLTLSDNKITEGPMTGLFYTIGDAVVQNLNVVANYDNSNGGVTQDNFVYGGILAGDIDNSVIFNCTTAGSVTNSDEGEYVIVLGGIAGLAKNSRIACCTNLADIKFDSLGATNEKTCVGGIVGVAGLDTEILWCYEKAGIVDNRNRKGEPYIGGIAGCMDRAKAISASYCGADVTGTNNNLLIDGDPITFVDASNREDIYACYFDQTGEKNQKCDTNLGEAIEQIIPITKSENAKAYAWVMNTSVQLDAMDSNVAIWGIDDTTKMPCIVNDEEKAVYRIGLSYEDGTSLDKYMYATPGEDITITYTPEKYNLVGVKVGNSTFDAEDNVCTFKMPQNDGNGVLILEKKQYSITYHLDEGENSKENPSTYTFEDEVVLVEPTKEHYNFAGWFQSADFAGGAITKIGKGASGNIEFYAKWEPKKYAIHFADETLKLEDIVVGYGLEIASKKPVDPQSEDNIFLGWYSNEACTEAFEFDKMPGQDVTLYAKWGKISAKDITVEVLEKPVYDGTEKTPKVKLTYKEEVLDSQDYEIAYANNVNAGEAKITITGKKKYEGTKEVAFSISKSDEGLSVAKTTYEVQYGDEPFTVEVTTKGTGKVSFSSSDENVASVDADGKVTIKAIGSATITVVTEEDANYKESKKTVTVKVVKKDHPGKEHTLQLIGKKDASCSQEGYTGDQYCKDCGDLVEKGTVVSKLAHECKVVGRKEATCTATGYTGDLQCSVCNTIVEKGESIPIAPHTPGIESGIIKNATCVEAGTKYIVCAVCKNTYTEVISATGVHGNKEIRDKVEATYTSTGYTGDVYCKDCGTLIERGQLIPKKDATSGLEDQKPSTQTPGTSTQTPGTSTQTPGTPTQGSNGTQTATPVKTGSIVAVNDVTYKVLSDGNKKSVIYMGGDVAASEIEIPEKVTINEASYEVKEVSADAFADYKNLKKITIPKSVTKIGDNAFKNCVELTSVVISKNVTQIGKNAFKGCKKLKKVTFKGTKIKKIGKNAFKNIAKKSVIKVPKSKKSKYKSLLKKSGYKNTVK